jgi:hypothetical protein
MPPPLEKIQLENSHGRDPCMTHILNHNAVSKTTSKKIENLKREISLDAATSKVFHTRVSKPRMFFLARDLN